jgi:threonine aldolase
MSNLIAIASQADRGQEVWVDSESHVLHYELAGSAVIAGVQLRTFDAANAGCPTAAELRSLQRLADPAHEPDATLVCLEQTHNRRGGSVATLGALQEATDTAHALGMRVHLDGARLGNAAVALGVPLRQLAAGADSVSLSLSGSVWVGSQETRALAHIWRKRLGGGMRQAGVLAAAGLWALEHQLPRLGEDHHKARRFAELASEIPGLTVDPAQVATNIVLLETRAPAADVLARAEAAGVLMVAFGPHTVRAVTHLDVSLRQVEDAASRLRTALLQP